MIDNKIKNIMLYGCIYLYISFTVEKVSFSIIIIMYNTVFSFCFKKDMQLNLMSQLD